MTAESIKIPEGFQVDEPTQTEFLGIMNNDKLSGAERAQQLIDLQAKFAQSQSDALTAAWETQQETWRNEVAADKDIGGDKLEPALADIKKVVLEYGSPEVNDILTNTGAGNNIHVIKMMHKIAKALNEGTGHASGNPAPQEKSAAQKLFPSMK
ncbi:MAG TPA: hypothetical protein VIM69_10630 [Opitutaceae bacterium]